MDTTGRKILLALTSFKRIGSFLSIGLFTAFLSYCLLLFTITVLHIPDFLAYAIQTITTIEANFLLNRAFTFKDRSQKTVRGFITEFIVFHTGKVLVTIPFNQILFNTIVYFFHTHYMLANTFCIVVTTLLNYLLLDSIIYTKHSATKSHKDVEVPSISQEWEEFPTGWPDVCVVIPCKNNGRTIMHTLTALRHQYYPGGRVKVILVGNKNDATWTAIPQEYREAEWLSLVEVEVRFVGRDANYKRKMGAQYALNHFKRDRRLVFAYTDADNVPHSHWILRGVRFLTKHQLDCVAGPMETVPELLSSGVFWPKYTDENPYGAKTPRVKYPYIITRENFGVGHSVPPVTANAFFWADVYERVEKEKEVFNPNMRNSFEDYAAFWVLVRYGGIRLQMEPSLVIGHYHRMFFKTLLKDYTRAGRGCMDFSFYYPDAPMVKLRKMQLIAVVSATAACVLTMGITLAISPSPLFVLLIPGVILLALLSLGTLVAIKLRYLYAIFFPLITAILSGAYCSGMVRQYFVHRTWKKFSEANTERHPAIVVSKVENTLPVQEMIRT